jgi:hypothetical protein
MQMNQPIDKTQIQIEADKFLARPYATETPAWCEIFRYYASIADEQGRFSRTIREIETATEWGHAAINRCNNHFNKELVLSWHMGHGTEDGHGVPNAYRITFKYLKTGVKSADNPNGMQPLLSEGVTSYIYRSQYIDPVFVDPVVIVDANGSTPAPSGSNGLKPNDLISIPTSVTGAPIISPESNGYTTKDLEPAPKFKMCAREDCTNEVKDLHSPGWRGKYCYRHQPCQEAGAK